MKTKIFLTTFLVFFTVFFLKAQVTIVEWNFPNNPDNNLVDVASTVPNNSGSIITAIGGVGAPSYSVTGAITWCAWATGWNGGSGSKAWEINFSTIGCQNLDVSSKQRSSGTGPRDFKIQYKIGVGGTYTDVPGASSTCGDNFTSGVITNVSLPTICENQPLVYLRWVMTSLVSVNNGVIASGGTSRIDEIVVNCNSIGYYQSVASGKWKDKAIWLYSPDNIVPYVAADTIPSYASQKITINSGHTVVIDSSNYSSRNCNFMLDEVYINSGGALHINGGYVYFNNGALVDINVDGELMDSLSNVITPNGLGYINWLAGATWVLGSSGSFIKTRNSSNSFYQSNYAGGIANIPSTANWILRKTSTVNPNMLTVGMYYPNFIMENTTGSAYTANTFGSYFSGNSPCTIYGDFKINSIGLNAIIMYDSIVNDALIVKGNMIVNSSGNLILSGDSILLEGDLTVNGSLGYSTTNANSKTMVFSGSNAQMVQPAVGSILFYNLAVNKTTNDVTVRKGFSVDKNLDFVNGKLLTTNTNTVTFTDLATSTNYNNSSFIEGPCIKTGSATFIFPVGKGNDVQTIGMSASSGTVPFWNENFNNGCTTGCIADSYLNANGSWTITDFGPSVACSAPVEANEWFISCAENGNAVSACGTGCGNNATLHVSSTSTSPDASITCPTGDCGATYDSGGNCFGSGTGASTETDKQIESPIINCSTQSKIALSFKYIAVGNASDTASLWFYDGVSTWQLLTTFTPQFCVGGQGLWRSFNIQLPQTAEFNSNVQIAFRWTNDDDGIGSTTSFAVDDITLASGDEFRAEYFYTDPKALFGNNLQAGIDHISSCEYWDLSRTRGLSNRQVTLSWDSNSCGVNSYSDLTVARYNTGTNQWRNHGSAGFTGNNSTGTVTSSLISSVFCPYTLASVNGLNPLPIELLTFTAKPVSNMVELNWQTTNETMNNYFIVQKSRNLIAIVDVEKVSSQGNATTGATYRTIDNNPYEGASYYRLKQVDINGNYSFSNWESVKFQNQSANSIAVAVNGTLVNFSLNNCCKGTLRVKVIDLFGRVIFENIITSENNNQLNMNGAAKGVYILSVENYEGVFNQKFVY